MKLRLPLYARILGWFFLNLFLLGLVFYVFFRVQFHWGLNSLLLGRAGDRIQAVGELLMAELRETARPGWNGLVERFSAAYQVEFFLFRADGVQEAGAPVDLPTEVRQRMAEVRGRAEPPRHRAGPGFGRGGMGGPPGPPERVPHPRFMVQTTHPKRYWVGVRIPPPETESGRPMPFVLLARWSSLRGGGLFLDLTPWAVVGFAALLGSMLFWIPLVRGITRSISQITAATARIAEGQFEARVPAERRDELGVLAQAINRMAARLEGFVGGQKRFLGDIAHELCSPLARLQLALGILDERVDAPQRSYVQDVREEAQQMSALVNELLSFSRAGLQPKEIVPQPVRLAATVERVVSRETRDAPTAVVVRVDPGLEALAEPELLARALANLVRNALRYGGGAGPVEITAAEEGDAVRLVVADAGPGVPPDLLERIFDPFFRVEASRSRETGGAGLGLAIVKTCVAACGGTVRAVNRSPTGLAVEIRLEAPPM
jgi:two-component system sensor histidine kinase CpxA